MRMITGSNWEILQCDTIEHEVIPSIYGFNDLLVIVQNPKFVKGG